MTKEELDAKFQRQDTSYCFNCDHNYMFHWFINENFLISGKCHLGSCSCTQFKRLSNLEYLVLREKLND